MCADNGSPLWRLALRHTSFYLVFLSPDPAFFSFFFDRVFLPHLLPPPPGHLSFSHPRNPSLSLLPRLLPRLLSSPLACFPPFSPPFPISPFRSSHSPPSPSSLLFPCEAQRLACVGLAILLWMLTPAIPCTQGGICNIKQAVCHSKENLS